MNIRVIIIRLLTIALVTVALGCGQKTGHDHESEVDSVASEGNQALYEEVMKIHDEAMAKMGKIYAMKRDLNEKIKGTSTLSEAEVSDIQNIIAHLDSADRGMMDWMHKFEPIGDSEGEEKAREYLESEMEKVKRVRSEIEEALAEGTEKLKAN